VKGKRLGRDDQKASVLTFVVDTSGSMDTAERLGLVKKSLLMLIGELDPADRVAIVQVDSEARLILEHTPAAEAGAIRSAIEGLQCSGSTHLDAGIVLGYDVATRGFVGGAVNRVLILSDGAANLGSANPEEILARVEASRKQGILCSVFGFGLGTYNDVMLETLANRGDGVYRFIDSEDEARRVFVDDLSAALQVIARDVKIQVEFDPRPVAQYRQLGYENRQLQAEDFRNDAIDAGEVGSGQSVTALYELILTGETDGPLGTVRIRYRDEDSGKVEEITREIRTSDLHASAAEAGARFQLAAGAAEFAELLRNSPFAADGNYDAVADLLRPVALELHLDQRASELLDLVQRAGRLPAP
jgi:Ca-activated chloride channel family protein